MDAFLNLFTDAFWATATFISVIVVYLTSTINAKLNLKGIWKQVISWVLSIGFTVGAYFLNIISVADPVWLSLIGIGIVVGLSSNGIYDIPFIKSTMKSWIDFLNRGKNPDKE